MMVHAGSIVLLALFFVAPCQCMASANKTTLNIGVLIEQSKSWYKYIANGFLFVYEHVLQDIREKEDLLPDFDFKLTVRDTEVSHIEVYLGDRVV